MARDVLDADLQTLLVQAASVAVQLRVQQPARAALLAIGVAPDELAERCVADRLAARDAWADSETAKLNLRGATRAAMDDIGPIAAWNRQCAAALDLAIAAAPAVPALRRIRDLVPTRKQRLEPLRASLREVLEALHTNQPAIAELPPLVAAVTAGRALLAGVEARAAIQLAAIDHAAATSDLRAYAKRRLRTTLRHVRSSWAAATLAAPFAVPALDLREAAASTWRRPAPRDAAAEPIPPGALTPADPTAPDPGALTPANPSEPTPPVDPAEAPPTAAVDCAPAGGTSTTVVVRVVTTDGD